MADVRVNRPAGQREEQGLSRRESQQPSVWSMNPSDFFTMSPFAMMRRFSDEMDRMFSGGARGERQTISGWTPAVEVSQKGDQFKVCAELPGMNKDDVRVEATEDGLVIEGERHREQESQEEGYYHSERSYGSFYRLIPLPEGANIDQARAEFRDGVLEVTVPVPEAKEKRRQIPIGAETHARQAQGGAGTSGMRKPEPATAAERDRTPTTETTQQRTRGAGNVEHEK